MTRNPRSVITPGIYRLSFTQEGVLLEGQSRAGLIRFRDITRWERVPGEEHIQTVKWTLIIESSPRELQRAMLTRDLLKVAKKVRLLA